MQAERKRVLITVRSGFVGQHLVKIFTDGD